MGRDASLTLFSAVILWSKWVQLCSATSEKNRCQKGTGCENRKNDSKGMIEYGRYIIEEQISAVLNLFQAKQINKKMVKSISSWTVMFRILVKLNKARK